MTSRLPSGGRLIDRRKPLHFRFDGTPMKGFAGDTLASALLAGGQQLLARSFKYHRPRSVLAAGPEEPNALVGLGPDDRFEPNARATVVELVDGLEARGQNAFPGLGLDFGAATGLAARLLPAGFYYKTFIRPRIAWKHLFEPVIRRMAGLGRAPTGRDPDRYEHFHQHADLVIVGGGIAGLQAALIAGRAGLRVWLFEQSTAWGGRAPVDGAVIDGLPAEAWIKRALAELATLPGLQLRLRTEVSGLYDHGYLIACERLPAAPEGRVQPPRQRLWRIRCGHVLLASGAIERPLAFAGNDLPGVMLAGAVRDYVVNWAVSPGDRTVIVTGNDDGYRTALVLVAAGLEVPRILDCRPSGGGDLAAEARALGIAVDNGRGIVRVTGRGRVRQVEVGSQVGEGAVVDRIRCEAVAMAGGWSPAVHLWSQAGGKLEWDPDLALFRPDPARPPTGDRGQAMVTVAGSANGVLETASVLADAARAAGLALRALGAGVPDVAPATAAERPEAPPLSVVAMPHGAGPALRAKMFVDFQNDVTVADLELAAQEGYTSVEHAKRYTTLGMATDQGKTSNINGLSVVSEALSRPVPTLGATTFRPPWLPLTFGTIAGEAHGALFQPERRTPIQPWHDEAGATFEPAGLWRRPMAFPRPGETTRDAIRREVRSVRQDVGIMDSSTLGKIIVHGADAGRFLDMVYTGRISSIAQGKCRYGLICNENGFLIDDGVVLRLGPQTWLCHTTSSGAEAIHQHMEDWLQGEWPDWQVHIANLTEQWAQIGLAGPKSRELLQRLGGMDVSAAALAHMGFAEGHLGGHPVRLMRISFSGELGYEIATPAGQGFDLWSRLMGAGVDLGLTPYGTGAAHVLRAEKGYVIVGDESDGTVTPQDLGLGRLVAGSKGDFIGKRAQERPFLSAPDRWQLVGLESQDGSVLPEGAHLPLAGRNANGQGLVQGRVTSTYFSPTLDRGIALALLRRGAERLGETVMVQAEDGGTVPALVVPTCRYDPEGARLHG